MGAQDRPSLDESVPAGPHVGPGGEKVDSAPAMEAVAGLDPQDPRVLQILSTEHWSLLSARSLVYNEAFTRVGTFLTLVSMSLVGLALLAQPMEFGRTFLVVAAITLAFDLLVGLATIARVLGAIDEDLSAMHGMSRIRHGYLEIAPQLRPYFTSPVHDDVRSVMAGYGRVHTGIYGVVYFLSTSLGLMVLLVSVIAGIVSVVVILATGTDAAIGVGIGLPVTLASFLGLGLLARRSILAGQAALNSLFPSPHDET
jgi:hypothetical protein